MTSALTGWQVHEGDGYDWSLWHYTDGTLDSLGLERVAAERYINELEAQLTAARADAEETKRGKEIALDQWDECRTALYAAEADASDLATALEDLMAEAIAFMAGTHGALLALTRAALANHAKLVSGKDVECNCANRTAPNGIVWWAHEATCPVFVAGQKELSEPDASEQG